MFDVQNIYNSAPPGGPHRRGVQRPRRVILFDLKQPGAHRELSDHGNVPHSRMPPTGSPITTDVGNSQFYAKYGIRPIHDSTENMLDSSATTQAGKMTRLYDDNIKFPKLEDCAHFHYDVVELNQIHVTLSNDNQENVYRPADVNGLPEVSFFMCVWCNDKTWTVRRTFSDLCTFDKQLHRCIYDRNYSLLRELQPTARIGDEDIPELRKTMSAYLHRFSVIAGSMINCGPILSWLEMDNRGNRLIVTDDSAINTPAVAAGHAIRRYSAKALDEISFEVGDIISIIDMPPSEESSWWRGKRGFEVGFFPSDTVEVISEKVPQAVSSKIPQTPVKPVLRKRGKLISFLRTFFTSRPTRTTLKRTGIMKERVFGCDLGEHLLNTGHDVPLVLKSCADVIEAEGIVDGIYRLSGVASNIQRLRNEFDEDRVPDLEAEVYQQDIHSVSSLVKMYFRELPNPLLTYQLYDKFAEAVHDENTKLAKLHDVIQQLPPPHYRTAEYLLRHLSAIAAHGARTGMHCKNLAIVWAPNLLRSKELEQSCTTAALQGVGIQAIVTECLIAYVDVLFNSSLHGGSDPAGRGRPKSLAISTPTRLLSLEEARERAMTIGVNRGSPKQRYIEVGGGSATLPAQYHTVIELPNKKKRKKSPNSSSSGWRGLFNRGKAPPGRSRNYSSDTSSEVMKDTGVITEDDVSKRRRLRPVRSCDSLLSAAATTPVKHSAGQAMPRPVIDCASGAGLRSKSCDTSYESELEYRDDSPLTDEVEVFAQPSQQFPSNVFSHDTPAVTIVMASDATAPKTNFMSELEEKLHSRSASIDSRSQWTSDHSHPNLVIAVEVPDVPDQCHSLPENFALRSLPSPTPAPRSNLPTPTGVRLTSYDNMIYDVPKDLFARRLPGDAHVMRPSSAWTHENLGSSVSRDPTNVCGHDRCPSDSSVHMPSNAPRGQTSQRDDDMHVSGVEGAACELAHYDENPADDIFHGNSAANTDSDSEFDRREAPSCRDDFSADIFSCLEKRCREVNRETLYRAQPDIDTPAEGASGQHAHADDNVDVYVKEGAVCDSRSVDVTSDHLSPVTPTNASEPLMAQERVADPTEFVTCVEVGGDDYETVDVIPCVSDMSKSSDDNMTPASDVSKSLESMLEEAGGGSLCTLAETTESCASDSASVTLGATTSPHHDSSSSIDCEIRAAVQLHEDTLHCVPPELDDTPQLPIDGAASPANESIVVLSSENEAGVKCHAGEPGRTSVDHQRLSSGVPVEDSHEILDGYLYAGTNQIELSDNEVEYVDPWSRRDDTEREMMDQTQPDMLSLPPVESTQPDESSPLEPMHQTQRDPSPFESTQRDASSPFESMDQTQQGTSSPVESTPRLDDILPEAPSYYDLYVARSVPSVPAPRASPSPPASPTAEPHSPQAERGHIVIRRPVGLSSEGAVQQVQATRLTPAVRYSGATTPPLPSAWSAPPLPSPRRNKTPSFPSASATTKDNGAADPAPECTAAAPVGSADTNAKNMTFQCCDTYATREVSPAILPAAETSEDKKPVGGAHQDYRQPSAKKNSSQRSQIGSSRFGERATDSDKSSSDNREAHRRVAPEDTATVDEVESDEASFTMRAAKDEHMPSGGVKRKKSVRELLSQFEKGKSADDDTRQTTQKVEAKPCETVPETDDQQKASVVLIRPLGSVRANVDWSSVRVIDATRSSRDDDSRYTEEKTSGTSSPPRCARRSSLSFQQRFKQFESQESSSASTRQLGDVACAASPRTSAEKEIGSVAGRGQSGNVSEPAKSVERVVETPPIDIRPEPAPRIPRVSDRWKKPEGDKAREPAKRSDSSVEDLIVCKPTQCSSEPSRRQPLPRSRESFSTSENSGSLSKSRPKVEPSPTEGIRLPGLKKIIVEEKKKAPETKRISLLTEADRPKTLSERLQLFESSSSGGQREGQDKMGSVGDVGSGARRGPKEDVSVSVRGLSEKFEQRASLRRSAHTGSTSSQDSDACGSPSSSMANKRLLVGSVDLAKPCGVAL